MRCIIQLIILCNMSTLVLAFTLLRWPVRGIGATKALEPSEVEKLSSIRDKYQRLTNVATPEAEQEAASLSEIASKYNTYLEVKKLMIKFRSMYKNESSNQRKAKQLRSFVNLYENKLELEQILREKLGVAKVPGGKEKDGALAELERINKYIEQLESKLEDVELKIAPGKVAR